MKLYFILFYLVINALAMIMMGLDKIKAIRGKFRIRELSLMGVAAVGGSFGSIISMILFRHKINKPLFRYGIPSIGALHLGLFIWFCWNYI